MARFENQQPPFVWKNIAGKSSRNTYSEILDTMDKVDWFSTNIEFCTNDRVSHRNTFRTTYYNVFLNTRYNDRFSSRLTNHRTVLCTTRYYSVKNARNFNTYFNVCSDVRGFLCSTIWRDHYSYVRSIHRYFVGGCPSNRNPTYGFTGVCGAVDSILSYPWHICGEHVNNVYTSEDNIISTASSDTSCTTDHGTYYGNIYSSFNSDVYANNHNVYNGTV